MQNTLCGVMAQVLADIIAGDLGEKMALYTRA